MKTQKGKVVRYNKWGYFFLIPFIVVYVVFQLIPLIISQGVICAFSFLDFNQRLHRGYIVFMIINSQCRQIDPFFSG